MSPYYLQDGITTNTLDIVHLYEANGSTIFNMNLVLCNQLYDLMIIISF